MGMAVDSFTVQSDTFHVINKINNKIKQQNKTLIQYFHRKILNTQPSQYKADRSSLKLICPSPLENQQLFRPPPHIYPIPNPNLMVILEQIEVIKLYNRNIKRSQPF